MSNQNGKSSGSVWHTKEKNPSTARNEKKLTNYTITEY